MLKVEVGLGCEGRRLFTSCVTSGIFPRHHFLVCKIQIMKMSTTSCCSVGYTEHTLQRNT